MPCYSSLMTEHRLQTLEETIAHQDQQIADLSDMLIRQNKDIVALRSEITKLGGRIEDIQGVLDDKKGAPQSVAEEAALNKPPHY
jgi:uncharacterized coiled-coil protein SlyX